MRQDYIVVYDGTFSYIEKAQGSGQSFADCKRELAAWARSNRDDYAHLARRVSRLKKSEVE